MPEATVSHKFCCPTCGGEMIQKSQARLILVSLCMIPTMAVAFVFPWFWAPGTILALTGICLLDRGAQPSRLPQSASRRLHFAPHECSRPEAENCRRDARAPLFHTLNHAVI